MASLIYNSFLKKSADANTGVDFANDDIYGMLLANTYTPNRDAHDFVNDVSSHEVTATGYIAGGKQLSNVTTNQDNTNDWCKVDADDLSWTITGSMTSRYLAIYKNTGVPATSPLIALIDFGSDKSVTDNAFTIAWAANGIINIKQG